MSTELEIENEAIATAEESNLPYLVFKIKDNLYAVNGETINSIFVLEQPVTMVPRTKSHIKGIINVRSEVLPLVDLRVLLGIQPAEDDSGEFERMIELRKQDHHNWVNALRESVMTRTEFKLSRDPHKCKFGEWFDNYKPSNQSVAALLRQVGEVHAKVHQSGLSIDNFSKQFKDDIAAYEANCYPVLEQLEKELMPKLIGLLDEAVKMINEEDKKMVVILQDDKEQIGITVDEVLEVTSVFDAVELAKVTTTHHSRFVSGIGHIEESDKEILLLNVSAIVNDSN